MHFLQPILFLTGVLWKCSVAVLFFSAVAFLLGRTTVRNERRFLESRATRADFPDVVVPHLPNLRSDRERSRDLLRLQAAALRAAANGIVITNKDGRIEWVNPAFTQITGFAMDEATGNSPRILKSGKHGSEFYQDLWSTISSGRVWRGEVTNRRKDGTEYTEEMTITPVVSMQGEITHYIGIKQDITARRHAEEALRRAEERYREIFDQAVVGIFQSTPEGHFVMMNPAMARMLDFDSPKSALDTDIRNLYGDALIRKGIQKRLEAEGTVHFEHWFSRSDGIGRWLSLNIRCVYGSDKKPAYYEGTAEDITSRKRADQALEESEELFRLFIKSAPVALAMLDREMRYLLVSTRWIADFQLNGDPKGRCHYDVFPNLPEHWKEEHRRALAGEIVQNQRDSQRTPNGDVQWLRREIRPWYGKDGKVGGIVIFSEDITERETLENQLRQAQKMEAVGRLAGGVAHDFNNILNVITGYSELLRLRTNLDQEAITQIEEIHAAGRKAASLTQQLLAFSRKQIVQKRILDINDILTKLSSMLRRLIGEDIELILKLTTANLKVNVDANQIDQLIMNLAVNARDAMPTGGRLTIETDVCDLDESYAMTHAPVRPGRYVRLTVSDNGCGMDRETIAHLFEPFFTTKEMGRGTGLGLSIVYGIVKQSEGYIWVYSEPDRGTSFKIYLPFQSAEMKSIVGSQRRECVGGAENVLVVEDDHRLRSLVVGFLQALGYSVLEAENGQRAMEIATALPADSLHALITDIVMPKLSGRELADRLLEVFPKLRVLYTSGYTHDSSVQTRGLSSEETFLQKPFALSELGAKLREMIDGSPSAAAKSRSRSAVSGEQD
jgi:PAS domain S-box-containing protein